MLESWKNRDGCESRGSRSACIHSWNSCSRGSGTDHRKKNCRPSQTAELIVHFLLACSARLVSGRTRRCVTNQAKCNGDWGAPRDFTNRGPCFDRKFSTPGRCIIRTRESSGGQQTASQLKNAGGLPHRGGLAHGLETPKARRDRKPLERHNRIVHLAKAECPIPAGSKLACVPPYSRYFLTPANPPPALQRCRQRVPKSHVRSNQITGTCNPIVWGETRARRRRRRFYISGAEKHTSRAKTHHDKHSASCFGMQLAYLTSTVATPSNFLRIVSASSLVAFSFKGLGAPSTRSLASFSPSEVTSRTALIVLILFAP